MSYQSEDDPTLEDFKHSETELRRSSKVVVALSSLAVISALALLATIAFKITTIFRRRQWLVSAAFVSLTFSTLCFGGTHATYLATAARDMKYGWAWNPSRPSIITPGHLAGDKDGDGIKDYDQWYWGTDKYASASVLLPALWLIFELLAARLLWYAIVRGPGRPGDPSKYKRPVITFIVFDLLIVIGVIIAMSLLGWVMSIEYSFCSGACLGSTQYAALFIEDGYILIIILPFMLAWFIMIFSGAFLTRRWFPTSPLGRIMPTLLLSAFAFQIATHVLAIGIYFGLDINSNRTYTTHPDFAPFWKGYYATIPLTLAQVVSLATFVYIVLARPCHLGTTTIATSRAAARPDDIPLDSFHGSSRASTLYDHDRQRSSIDKDPEMFT